MTTLMYRQGGKIRVVRDDVLRRERVLLATGSLGVPYSQLSPEEKAELAEAERSREPARFEAPR